MDRYNGGSRVGASMVRKSRHDEMVERSVVERGIRQLDGVQVSHIELSMNLILSDP